MEEKKTRSDRHGGEEDGAYRKQQKAGSPTTSPPRSAVLRALEAPSPPTASASARCRHLATAAASLPRLFKPVLGVVVDGMAQLATAAPCPASTPTAASRA